MYIQKLYILKPMITYENKIFINKNNMITFSLFQGVSPVCMHVNLII